MAGEIGTAYVGVALDPRGIQSGLGRIASSSAGRFSAFGRTMGVAFASAFGVAAAAGIGGFVFLKNVTDAAADYNETLNVTRAIFGKNARAMESWAETTADGWGIAKDAALEGANTFGDMFAQLGLAEGASSRVSRRMVEMAGDFASFKNLEPAEVIDMIGAAFRGEYDSLQRVIPGINAARVQEEALRMTHKDSADELTNLDKALATNKIILKDGERAIGDAKKTGDSYVGQLREMRAKWQDLKIEIGQKFLPIATTLIRWLNDKAPAAFKALEDVMTPIADAFRTALPSALDALEPHFQALADGVGPLVRALGKTLPKVIQSIGPAIGTIAQGVGRLAPVLGEIIALAAEKLAPVFRAAAEIIRDAIIQIATVIEQNRGKLTNIFSAIAGLLKAIEPIVRVIFTQVLPLALENAIMLLDKIADVIQFVTPFVRKYAEVWAAVVTRIVNVIRRVRDAVFTMKDRVVQAWNAVKSGVSSAVGAIGRFVGRVVNFFRELPGKAVGFLRSLPGKVREKFAEISAKIAGVQNTILTKVEELATGILDGIVNGLGGLASALYEKLKGEILGAIDRVKGFFGFGSPSRWMAENVGKPLAQGVAVGIAKEEKNVARALTNMIAGAARRGNFDVVSSIIQRRFGALQAGRTTVSERAIQAIERRREEEGLTKALQDATAAQDAAAIRTAKEDLQLFNLRLKAERERAVLEERQFQATLKLDRTMRALEKAFAKATKEGGVSRKEARDLAKKTARAQRTALKLGKQGGKAAAPRKPLPVDVVSLPPSDVTTPVVPPAVPTLVRVFIGDEELRGIVRTEVDTVDAQTARVLLGGVA